MWPYTMHFCCMQAIALEVLRNLKATCKLDWQDPDGANSSVDAASHA